ncbi:A-kinase anchor protein 17B [Phascolarctos cinereus]|nr:A-kinase anchor protein 17B isoform X2 [Phascolarctos cinereus]XP_020830783.1 A-kinase anchor protein 17B isoform X2 [Phascolarctos cinereus]XP_020830784.1 A-kinase anchor protein 17B isoform X2 [Phascolarctos cinereus]XP_020830785.1 A-kinase anchor protein 17B isoform X2 [Phascolarctos cinereus]
MTVSIVYDNSEAMELCAAQHLYLKPIARLTINVMLPEDVTYTRSFSNWEILDQLKNLICPDQFSTVRLSKSTKDFIRFEGEAETRSLGQILKAKLHGKIIRLNGLKNGLKIVATDAWLDFPSQQEWELASQKNKAASDELLKQNLNESPDSIYFQGLPCKWFASKGSSGEKPCEEILRVVFESFGKIKNIDIPMLDPYREVMATGTFNHCTLGSLQTFEAFIQYQEYADFVKAMESLRGMKLMLKGEDGKALACNIKVMFDTTQHFSEGAIRKRNQERLKLQELEQERKREKKREEAERKRKDDEKKLREKKRKTKIKKKEQKQKPKEEKRPKKKAKAEECGKVNNQEVENPKPEEACVLEYEVKTLKKEEPNPPNLLCQEAKKKTSKKKSVKCERTLIPQSKKRNDLSESSCHLEKTLPDDPAEGEGTDKLIPDTCKHSFVSHLNSLQITIKQDLSQAVHSVEEEDEEDDDDEEEDWHLSNKPSNPRLRKEGYRRKQKIYETDEFIHYLLNYYQPPQYARVYEDTKDAMSKSWWRREVHDNGNGFQINLNQSDHHISQNGQKVGWTPKDDQQWKLAREEWEPRPRKAINTSRAEEFAKTVEHHYIDPGNEAADLVSNVGGKQCPWQNSHIGPMKDYKYKSKRKSSSQSKFAGFSYEVTDFLEEISSDSDCFNETLSEESEQQSSSPNAGRLVKVMEGSDYYTEIVAFDQEKKCSQCGMCPKLKPIDLTKPLRSKLKKTVKRSRNELKCPGPKGECETNGVEENTRKKKKKPFVEDRLDEDNCPAPDPSSLRSLKKPEKKRSKTMESKMKCKASCMPIASSQSVDVPLVQGLSEDMSDPWKLKSDQDIGISNRWVKWKEGTPNSNDCLASCDSPDPLASENGFKKRSSVFKLKSF